MTDIFSPEVISALTEARTILKRFIVQAAGQGQGGLVETSYGEIHRLASALDFLELMIAEREGEMRKLMEGRK